VRRIEESVIAEIIVRRRHWIVAAWLVFVALVLPYSTAAEKRLDVSASVSGSESERVGALLARNFQSAFPNYAVLVVTGADAPSIPSGRLFMSDLTRPARSHIWMRPTVC
jgi:uncharacterized membrane protein YdfJ with MMPL/SSD domain